MSLGVRPRWRWLAAAAFTAASLACDCGRPATAEPAVAQLERTSGAVMLRRGENSRPARVEPLLARDALITGEDGAAHVRFPGGRELVLGPGTFLRLGDERAELLSVTLEEGTLVSRGAGSKTPLRVRTPLGEALTADGEATVRATRRGLLIEVAAGEVQVVGADGGVFTASPRRRFELVVEDGEVVELRDAGRPEPQLIVTEPIEVVLTAPKGHVLLQGPTGPAARVTKARVELAAQSLVTVAPGGRATVSAGGIEAALSGGARVKVGAATRMDGVEALAVELSSGAVDVRFEAGAARELSLDADAGVKLSSSERTHARVVAGSGQSEVQVQVGALTVTAGGQTQAVQAGETASATGGGLRVKRSPRPALTLSCGKRVKVWTDRAGQVALSWPEGLETSPVVEVAADPGFFRLLMGGRARRGALQVPAPMSGELHWRVLSPDGGVQCVGAADFDPDPGAHDQKAERVHAVVEDTGPGATVIFQQVVPPISLRFQAVEGAVRYRVRVYRVGALDQAVAEHEVPGTECVLRSGALTEGEYAWCATGVSSTAAELGAGRMNPLRVVYDNARTRLAISRPVPGERVKGAEVAAEGVAPVGARLTINGVPVEVDAKGRFSTKVEVAPALTFRVQVDGAEHIWVRHLRPK